MSSPCSKTMISIKAIQQNWYGIFLAMVVGSVAVLINEFFDSPILDPLLVALVIGIVLRTFIKFNNKFIPGFVLTPMLFIPVGVIFYGAVNLDFVKFASVNPMFYFMVAVVFIVYITSVFLLGTLFDIKEKVTYLITTGSAICGASAIAITSDAIDAEPDDVSNSLIPVFASALLGLFVIFPFVSNLFNMSAMDYGIMSGALLQFTGFVKAAASGSGDLVELALSVKAVRYLGLLILIPLFSSFAKGRVHVPWYLWAFLGAGILFSFMPDIAKELKPIFKPTLNLLWAIAMAAIGLNASIKSLFSKKGLQAFAVSFISFLIATGIFLGMYLMLREMMIA